MCLWCETSTFRYFGVWHTGNLDDKAPGHNGEKIPKSRNATGLWCGISTFRQFGCREVEEEAIFGIESFKLLVRENLKDLESSDNGGS